MRTFLLRNALLFGALAGVPVTALAQASCESLLNRAITPTSTVIVAQSIPAGPFTAPNNQVLQNMPAFCRVRGLAKPVPASNIHFEVWMPQSGWNGKVLMFGNGGYSSSISFGSMGQYLARGYATVGTDTGHTGDDPAPFVEGAVNPEIIADWGHRAVHESIVNAKAVVTQFTGAAPQYAYFSGCSTGGHQGLMEAQRYPGDFDGIVAGAPGNNRTNLNAGFMWQFLQNHEPGDNANAIIPASKLPVVTAAVVQACRGNDGGLPTDAYLTDPRKCSFDPGVLQCAAGDAPDCLTPRQVQAMRAMYEGAHDPRTGRQVYPGWPLGSEAASVAGTFPLGWNLYWGTTAPQRVNFWRYWVYNDPAFDWWDFDFGADMQFTYDKLSPLIDANDPDLRPFASLGHKLLMYTGFADPVVSAHDTIAYHEKVVKAVGGVRGGPAALARADDAARLFMVPGMGHCGGGPGPNNFDTLTALERWVEQGIAPERIVATKFVNDSPAQGVQATRPLCPYPQVATYDGTGNPNDAASFACTVPAPALAMRIVPDTLNLRSTAGTVMAVITAPGVYDLRQWMPANVRLATAPMVRGALSADGQSFVATFNKRDLAGVATGEHVSLELTGSMNGTSFTVMDAVRVVR